MDKVSIKDVLIGLGQVSQDAIEVFSSSTRDKSDLTVFRDKISGVIFIDEYYVGNSEYVNGNYRKIKEEALNKTINYEDYVDSKRRISNYAQFIVGKNIADFGCGHGSFLNLAKTLAQDVCGIELQEDCIKRLKEVQINCYADISNMPDQKDSIFLFHSFEHLPDPISTLVKLRQKLKGSGKGRIIIEVPHANDFLLSQLRVEEFLRFTLWSQHLILHTRGSLYAMLEKSGFKEIRIHGVQRYGLGNHLNWLNQHAPGGHKNSLSVFEDVDLFNAYANALARIDSNDTLVAIAEA